MTSLTCCPRGQSIPVWQTLSQLDRGVNCHRSRPGPLGLWGSVVDVSRRTQALAQFLAFRCENRLKWIETLETVSCLSRILHQTLALWSSGLGGTAGIILWWYGICQHLAQHKGDLLVTFKGGDYTQRGRESSGQRNICPSLRSWLLPLSLSRFGGKYFSDEEFPQWPAPGRRGQREEGWSCYTGWEKHSPDRIFGVSNL